MVEQAPGRQHGAAAARRGGLSPARRLVLLVAVLVVLGGVAVPINLRFAARARVRSHVREGIRQYQKGDVAQAVREWRVALQQDPTYPDTYRLLAEALIDHGSPGEAVPLLNQLRRIAPGSEHLDCRLAEAVALSDESGPAAYEAAKRAVAREPGCARAHALFGIQNSNRQNHAVAVSELSRAFVLDPGSARIALSLAQAQLDGADLDGAERTLTQVLARTPQSPKGQYLLGCVYARRSPTPDNLQKARNAFQTAYRLDPAQDNLVPELGRLSVLAGDYQNAITLLEKAWQQGPQTPEVAFNLAKAYRGRGDAARASAMNAAFRRLSDNATRSSALEKRLAANPRDVEAALELADLQIEAKDWESATPLVQTLVNLRPNDARALRLAVRLLVGTGDANGAAQIRERLRQQQAQAGAEKTR